MRTTELRSESSIGYGKSSDAATEADTLLPVTLHYFKDEKIGVASIDIVRLSPDESLLGASETEMHSVLPAHHARPPPAL